MTIDSALFETAPQVSEPGINKADLIREALKTYIRVKSAKQLGASGTVPAGAAIVNRGATAEFAMDPKNTATPCPSSEDGKNVTPVVGAWDSFFSDPPAVTEDFMSERTSQQQPDREAL